MEEITVQTKINICQQAELTDDDQQLAQLAIASADHAYAPYSRFHVGAAVRLANGVLLPGCNQENAAFAAGICAERSAIFAAGAQYPDQPITAIAIAAKDANGMLTQLPVSPCGTCRQVIVETEKRFATTMRLILCGSSCVYVIEDGIRALMPLSFSEF